MICVLAGAQDFLQKRLTGTVLDENGQPMPGVVVATPDGKRGEMTDNKGAFTITLPAADETVVVSSLGYITQTVNVVGKENVTVLLVPDMNNSLNEVVVIGYGEVKKSDLTGAVTNVRMTEITETPSFSVDQSLQGRVAGMEVMTTSGEPGAGTSIRVRGTRSINAGNEPLVVVDGIDSGVSMDQINPDDIESISVLKDASATAIYGSRGANGVIMITTRKGVTAKPRVTANAKFGVSQLSRKLDIMNAKEFAQYYNDRIYFFKGMNSGALPSLDPMTLGEGTDWQDAITRLGTWQDYSVSLSGKDGKLDYFSSIGYTRDVGIVKGSESDRVTARLNLGYKFSKLFKLSYRLQFSFKRLEPNKVNIGGTNLRNGAIYLSPLIGERDIYNPIYENGAYIDTPVMLIENYENIVKKYDRNHTLLFDFTPSNKVKAQARVTYTTYQRHDYKWWSSALATRKEGMGTKAERYESDNERIAFEGTLTWADNFRGGHHLDAMAGGKISNLLGSNQMRLTADGLVSDYLKWNNMNGVMSKENYTATTYHESRVTESAFARFNYNYRERYYLTMTGRLDGASNFAENQKWGFFPSMAFKWNILKEPFMRGVKHMDEAALRLSIGESGNDSISNFASLQIYNSSTSGYIFDGSQPAGYYLSRVANPDLTWEKTLSGNVGLDLAMFGNRVKLTVDAYMSQTRDLLLNVKTSHVTGFDSRLQNLGRTSNKGIEISLETRNISKRNFSWTTMFTLSHNNQMVDDIGNEEYVPVLSSYGNNSYMLYGYKSGYPLNALWGFQYAGPWRSQEEFDANAETKEYASVINLSPILGVAKYVDVNHDGIISMEDQVYLGTSDPDLFGGLQNNFNYKDWKLSVYLSYSLGGKIYNYSEAFMAGGQYTNQYRYMLDAYHPVRNPEGWYPRSSTDDAFVPNTLMLHDASYLRLKTVTLSRTINFKKSKAVRSMTLSLTGENLWLWTTYNGFDPDVSTSGTSSTLRRVDMGAYPRSRKVIFGASIRF